MEEIDNFLAKAKEDVKFSSLPTCTRTHTHKENDSSAPEQNPKWWYCLRRLFASHKSPEYAKQTTYNWLFDFCVLYKFANACISVCDDWASKKFYSAYFMLCLRLFDCFLTKMLRIIVTVFRCTAQRSPMIIIILWTVTRLWHSFQSMKMACLMWL